MFFEKCEWTDKQTNRYADTLKTTLCTPTQGQRHEVDSLMIVIANIGIVSFLLPHHLLQCEKMPKYRHDTLHAASMVFDNAPADGSQWNTYAINCSCAVCIMYAQNLHTST